MDLYRLGIKFFSVAGQPIEPTEFIPIFHEWIQKQTIDNHLLIDVHNYSHIHDGPGILLVAHEGNFSTETADDRIGLLYYRKQPIQMFTEIINPLYKVTVFSKTIPGCAAACGSAVTKCSSSPTIVSSFQTTMRRSRHSSPGFQPPSTRFSANLSSSHESAMTRKNDLASAPRPAKRLQKITPSASGSITIVFSVSKLIVFGRELIFLQAEILISSVKKTASGTELICSRST